MNNWLNGFIRLNIVTFKVKETHFQTSDSYLLLVKSLDRAVIHFELFCNESVQTHL